MTCRYCDMTIIVILFCHNIKFEKCDDIPSSNLLKDKIINIRNTCILKYSSIT